MAKRFKDKIAVITGGAGGIGRALGEAFVKEGAKVALVDMDKKGQDEAVAALPDGCALALPCDISDYAAVQTLMDTVIQTWGGVDVLVNNAGITHRSLLRDTDPAVIAKVINVNLVGTVYCTKAALESLIERKGMVVAMSSIAGFAPLIGRTGYSASKHGLHGFLDSLRTELRDEGVGTLLACPGYTLTPIETNAMGGDGKKLTREKREIVGKYMTPQEVAQAIVDATAKRKKRLFVGPVSTASWVLSRLLPDVYEDVMLSQQSAEFKT